MAASGSASAAIKKPGRVIVCLSGCSMQPYANRGQKTPELTLYSLRLPMIRFRGRLELERVLQRDRRKRIGVLDTGRHLGVVLDRVGEHDR